MTVTSVTSSPTIDVTRLIATAPIGRFQLRVGGLCGVVTLLDGLDAQITGYLTPALAREWHLAGPAIGQIFSAGLAGKVLGLLGVGSLGPPLGRRGSSARSAAALVGSPV